jgi:hypothetical protein
MVQRLAARRSQGAEGPIVPRAPGEAEASRATPLREDVTEGSTGARLGLFYQLYFQNIGQQEVCEFLRHLKGPVIALRIEHFPSYAPELNPDEGVWALAKRDLANGRPEDIEELVKDLIHSIDRIQRSPAKLRGCILFQ